MQKGAARAWVEEKNLFAFVVHIGLFSKKERYTSVEVEMEVTPCNTGILDLLDGRLRLWASDVCVFQPLTVATVVRGLTRRRRYG